MLFRSAADPYHDVMTLLRNEKTEQIAPVSALTGEGMDDLVDRLASFVEETLISYQAIIPYKEAGLIAHARDHGSVSEERYEDECIILSGLIRKSQIGPLLPWIEH